VRKDGRLRDFFSVDRAGAISLGALEILVPDGEDIIGSSVM
jgi:hypothetical protein